MAKKKTAHESNSSGFVIRTISAESNATNDGSKEPTFLRKTIYVVTGICAIIFVIFICICLYKNDFTVESILSTFLAFFSIFISIFFYFKADDTSTKFYDNSYAFMKDISVTLGKIEERFGEKLNSLNEKITHLDRVSQETSREIEDKQEDKDSIINELLEQTSLNAEEKERYRRELEMKEKEIEELRLHRDRAEQVARTLRRQMNEERVEQNSHFSGVRFTTDFLARLWSEGEIPVEISPKAYDGLIKAGYVDEEGKVNKMRVWEELTNRRYL